MSLDADYIVDRRRIRRKLTFWRVLAVVVAIAAVVAVTFRFTQPDTILSEGAGAYIARVSIRGLIRNDQDRSEALDRLAKSRARAVIVRIDSPGGTAAGAEQLRADQPGGAGRDRVRRQGFVCMVSRLGEGAPPFRRRQPRARRRRTRV